MPADDTLPPESFRRAIAAMPVFLWISDEAGRALYFSEPWAAFTGAAPGEDLGMNYLNRLPAADAARLRSALAEARRQQKGFCLDVRVRRYDGVYRWCLCAAEPRTNEGGLFAGFSGSMVDVHDRKHAEAGLLERQAYFQNLLDSSPAIIWITDEESRCVYLSKPWYDFTGGDPARDLGYGWLENIHPGDLAAATRAVRGAGESRAVLSLEYRLRRRDGEYRWMVSVGHPRFDERGNFLGYVGTVIDVHERRLSTERLRESQQELETLAKFTPQMIWTARPDGVLDWYNERWYEFTGFPRDRVGDSSWEGILHPDDVQKCHNVWYTSVRTGDPYKIEYRFFDRRTQSYRWFLGQALAIRDEHGAITRWFGSCTDIHDQKTLSEELSRTISVRDEFLAVASHELRTPLTSLQLQAQTFERAIRTGRHEYASPARAQSFAQTAVRQATRLSRLVDDMLDVSRFRTGPLSLHREEFDLGALAHDVARRLSAQLGAPVEPLVTVRGPVTGAWDYLRMEQALSNLLTNAFRYGGRSLVRVDLAGEEEFVELSVADQGAGIPASHLERIFEPYERAGVSASEVSGLGLGLFIVRQIVEAHGGSVRAESEVGAGARFLLRLPTHH